MHDHSRFQRDINDVTGVSLSLSLSLYCSQKSLTHNIGSASALPIISRQSAGSFWSDFDPALSPAPAELGQSRKSAHIAVIVLVDDNLTDDAFEVACLLSTNIIGVS